MGVVRTHTMFLEFYIAGNVHAGARFFMENKPNIVLFILDKRSGLRYKRIIRTIFGLFEGGKYNGKEKT